MRDPQPWLCATPISSLWYVNPARRYFRDSPPIPPASNAVVPMSVAENGDVWVLTEDGVTRLTSHRKSHHQAVNS